MPTTEFDALDQFVALSKCLAGLPVQDSYGQTAYPKLKSRITATMDALLDQINKENGFALQDDQKGPCRCAAHPEPNVHGTTLDELSDDARAELVSSFNKVYGIKTDGPEAYNMNVILKKACTTLVQWIQELCRNYGWQEVKIDIKPDGRVCPLIFPNQSSTNTKAAMTAADELRSIFGIGVTK